MEKGSLDINDFTLLLLATLAINSRIIYLEDKNKKTITLSIQYKQIIENILCTENDWKEEFSVLIDMEEYFKDHFAWERKFALSFKQTLNQLNKSLEYDFEDDAFLIDFTNDEANEILAKYPDETLRNIMTHFVYLLMDDTYTRYYQENVYDHFAPTVERMHRVFAKKRV